MRLSPLVALLTSLLVPFHAVAGLFGKDGPPLSVERDVSQYLDWNTGMQRERVTYILRMNGRKLSDETITKAVGAKEDKFYATNVFAAISAGPNDALVLYGSNGLYSLATLHVEGKTLSGKTLLNEVTQNWFTDARMAGWVSVQQEGRLHLVQLNPVKVVDVGPGVLLDVRGDIALLANEGYRGPQSTIRAVSIGQGKQVAEVSLPTACFALPRFEFTHPAVYGDMEKSSLEVLLFKDGPAWFDANFTLTTVATPTLQLKSTQQLPRPSVERWYVALREPDLGRPPRKPEEVNYASTPSFDNDDDTIDPEPVACAGINPNPGINAGKAPYPTQTIMAEDLCLGADLPGITDAMRKQRCVLPATTKVITKAAQWQLEEVRFAYRPQNGKAPIEQLVYQLREGKQVHRAIAGALGEDLRLREVAITGEGQALIKARGEGAYELFRLSSAPDGKRLLEFLDTVPYPATPFDTSKPGWVYQRSAGFLMKAQPFGFERIGKGLLDVRGDELLYYYRDYDTEELVLLSKPFQPEPQDRETADDGPRLTLSAKCRMDDDPYWEFAVPPVNATLAQSAAWFSRHFDYTNGKAGSIVLRKDHQLRVKRGCVSDGGKN